ncbi:MAG TPA: CHRD domain-containing protein [Steroidobacteraceae bacterium]|nr:CHRD domain-containing protein [Steroidobacteraceae bacterium]
MNIIETECGATPMTARALRWSAAMLLCVLSACGGGGGGGDDEPSPPTVTLSKPVGTTVNRTIELTASPTTDTGVTVTRVEFLVDGTVIGNVTAAPFTASWDTSTTAEGAHQLTARVTDSNNQVVTSDAVAVTVANQPTIDITLTPGETFPRPNSTATGTGQFTFNLINGAVTGSIDLTGITATLAHIHSGAAATAGPIEVNLVQSSSNPNHWDVEPGATFTPEQIDQLLRGELYVNVHSAAYPAGEIRAQLKPTDVQIAVAYMSGDDVSPPVTTTASGIAGATVNTATNVATVHLTTAGVDDATDAHVHVGQLTVNATTPLLTLTKDPSVPSHWSAIDQTITAANYTSLSNGEWYADVHTPANPNGELRAQLTTDKAPAAPPPPAAATLAELQSTIFTPICATCHSGGGSALPGSMNLSSTSASFAALVNVNSEEVPSLKRVNPNNPDTSYVVRKVEGAADIVGGRMPLGAPSLTAEQIANIRSWISSGAPNSAGTPTPPAPGY